MDFKTWTYNETRININLFIAAVLNEVIIYACSFVPSIFITKFTSLMENFASVSYYHQQQLHNSLRLIQHALPLNFPLHFEEHSLFL